MQTTRDLPIEDRGAVIASAIADFQAGGDRDRSFRRIFESYYRPLQRFFARKGCAPEICLDLTQETFLGIYKGLESYRPEARFETWLYKIATNCYLKWVRSQTTSKRSGQEISTDSVEGAEQAVSERALRVESEQLDGMLSREQREELRQAVRDLPPQMRRCLKLRIYQELSYREIAAALQVSIQTVKAHLFQARGKLKQRLEGL